MRTVRPLIIQDATVDPALAALPAAQLGLTRYLGVTVRSLGKPIGTLCFMDGRSHEPLGDDDIQFVSMLALRIETELERERLYLERTAEQRATLEKQQAELHETRQVLTAMNAAFELLSDGQDTCALLQSQVELLRGVMGFSTVAVLAPDPEGRISGFLAAGREALRAITLEPSAAEPQLCSLLGASLIKPLPLEEGRTGYLALAGRDVDDDRLRTHIEAIADQVCLLLATHRLQQRLVQTNLELKATHERLVQSEKLSVVGTLAASVAHDIRNIVSSLALECSMGAANPAVALENVRTQMDRFAVLSHRLLSYAKPKRISKEPVDLNELLDRVLLLLGAQLRVMSIEVHRMYSEGLARPVADQAQTEHLFINLVMNAAQAMTQGGRLCVSTCVAGDVVQVVVEDTGPGIKPEMAEYLFEPFQSSRSEGFGLGLFSCKRIADEHGWTLAVESQPGNGTRFVVSMGVSA